MIKMGKILKDNVPKDVVLQNYKRIYNSLMNKNVFGIKLSEKSFKFKKDVDMVIQFNKKREELIYLTGFLCNFKWSRNIISIIRTRFF